MSENILESYLVKLGFGVDTASADKFEGALAHVGKAVEFSTSGMVKNLAKWETVIVSTFAALGAGIIAVADKTAMADQSYRLMGMRMMMGKDAARAMTMATDALGASLDEIAYDPELSRRFQALYEQNIKLGKSIGGGFDQNMRSIRDIRMEYKRFGTEIEFLTMGTVSKLFEKLGFGTGDAVNQLDRLNDWFSTNLPAIADQTATLLVPVWKDVRQVLGDVGDNAKIAGGDFTYLVGVLSGDKSIQSTTFDVNNLAKALVHVADAAATAATAGGLVFKILGHTAMAGINYGASILQAPTFNTAEQLRYQGLGTNEAGKAFKDIRDLFSGTNAWKSNPDFKGIADREGVSGSPSVQSSGDAAQRMRALAQATSQKTGIPANLIYSQWAHETNGFTSPVFNRDNNAGGIRVPGTTEYRHFNSLEDFANSYAGTVTSPRYTSQGILNAKTDQDFAGSLKRGGYYEDSYANYAAGMHRWEPTFGGGDVNIQTIHITVPPGSSEDRMKSIITESMRDALGKRDQRTTAQVAAGAYY